LLSENKIIIAFIFKRSGKNKLPESEFYLPLSIELGWFSNKEAHEFINNSIKLNLLNREGKLLIPNFDIDSIDIPIGFTPSNKTYIKNKIDTLKNEKNILGMIIASIKETIKKDEEEIFEDIKKIAIDKNIMIEVAALFLARNENIDLKDLLTHVEEKILKNK
jgi:hypothetical protein